MCGLLSKNGTLGMCEGNSVREGSFGRNHREGRGRTLGSPEGIESGCWKELEFRYERSEDVR